MYTGQPRRVAIIGGSRIPFARSHTVYTKVGNRQMLTAAFKGLVNKFDLRGQVLGDVAAGAVIKHSSDFNLTRESVLGSGLSPETPGFDLQRACGTALESAIIIGLKIASGQIDSGIAGGSDSISDVPIVYPDSYRRILMAANRARKPADKIKSLLKIRPKHFKPSFPGVLEPRTGLSMGESCEIMAKQWSISRQDQDQLAMESHLKMAAAYEEGFYDDLVTEFCGLTRDNNMRADSSMEKLGQLKPAFDRKSGKGTLTAGNSTPLTDGASAVLLASEEWARERGLPIQAYLTFGKVAAVDFVHDEGLLMAPAYAVPRMLDDAKLSLQDFDFYEIHEAFAAQVLCTLKAWESDTWCRERLGRDALGSIDRGKLNVKGSSLAAGHPFAATGTRVLANAAKLLAEKGSGRALISICTAGGMGVTAILEAS